jgi:hypothetical protein
LRATVLEDLFLQHTKSEVRGIDTPRTDEELELGGQGSEAEALLVFVCV